MSRDTISTRFIVKRIKPVGGNQRVIGTGSWNFVRSKQRLSRKVGSNPIRNIRVTRISSGADPLTHASPAFRS